MPRAGAHEVARLLREYAQRTALRGGNAYRSKACWRAADSLAAVPVPLEALIAEGGLTEIPGGGEATADIITKLHQTGTHPSFEKRTAPAGGPCRRAEMLTVPELRPDKGAAALQGSQYQRRGKQGKRSI